MKKLVLFAVATLFVAVSGFSQAYTGVVTETAYDSLTTNQKRIFSEAGTKNPYGKLLKFDSIADKDILGVFKITGIPKSRKMLLDTTVTPNIKKPEFETQFMLIYNKEGKRQVLVTIDNPTINGADAASIVSLMANTGLKQGDDEFETDENNYQSTKVGDNYDIGGEW